MVLTSNIPEADRIVWLGKTVIFVLLEKYYVLFV